MCIKLALYVLLLQSPRNGDELSEGEVDPASPDSNQDKVSTEKTPTLRNYFTSMSLMSGRL